MRLSEVSCILCVFLLSISVWSVVADDSESAAEPEVQGDDEAAAFEEENDVIVLTDENFDEVAMTKDIILVEFYAPWCGHCKKLEPEYAKAAKRMKEADPPVPFGKVDATQYGDLARNYDVSGYPTLKILRKGKASDYDGPRDEEGIVQYMREQSDPNWEPPPSAVLTLTNENFDEIVDEAPLILVEFYAPWCGHCKKLAPEYEKAATVLENNDPPIPLAKIDATEEKDLATRFGVQGYPTLKIFRHGNEYEYKGPREAPGIIDYMKKQSGDSSTLLETMKDVQEFLGFQDDISILGFFENEEEHLYKVYMDAGNSLREDYRFSHTFLPEACETYKINPNSVVVFMPKRFQSKYEPKRYVYSENGPFIIAGLPDKSSVHLKVVDMVVDTEFWRQKVLEVASENDDITFAIADETEFAGQMKELELDDSGEEINVGLFDTKKQRFRMEPDEDFDADSLREFIQSWRDGKLKPVIKSQPVPKKNNGPVKIVTGKTFNDIVLDDSKDVLLEIYAPWCGHCKKLEPDYKKLGKKYKGNNNVVIAKIDGTANDIPEPYTHTGFPTIYFAKAGDKENPLKYEKGSRTLEALSEYIDENSSFNQVKDEL